MSGSDGPVISEFDDFTPRLISTPKGRHQNNISIHPSSLLSGDRSRDFIVDTRGDPKIVEYGTIHQYDIPHYHRLGFGHLIGASAGLRLNHGNQLAKEKPKRLLASKKLHIKERDLRLNTSLADEDGWDLQSNEIALQPKKKKQRRPASPESDTVDVDYRSIEGKAKTNDEPSDDDFQFVQDLESNPDRDAVETQAREHSALLSRKVKVSPADFSAWVELIECQTRVIFPHTDPLTLTMSEKRSIADVRITIYEKALRHFTGDQQKIESLIDGLMAEKELISDSSGLQQKWREVLRSHPTSFALWMKYLKFCQTNHTLFEHDACKNSFTQCLGLLGDRKNVEKAFENGPYFFLRLTSFFRDAGYTELAMSIWQLVLELWYHKPVGLDLGESFKSLEAFWDSDVPRIGESNARGWKSYASKDHPFVRPLEDTQLPVLKSGGFSAFADNELALTDVQFLPASTMEISDDPFRFVMFSDISPFLQFPHDQGSASSFLVAFLAFFSLPPLVTNDCYSQPWSMDALVHSRNNWLSCRPPSLQTLFDDAFQPFRTLYTSPSQNSTFTVEFVDRVLEQLCSYGGRYEDLQEYHICFKLATIPADVAKLAKKLLKAQPNSLRLYNAYALSQLKMHGIEKAVQVWRLASTMSPGAGIERVDFTATNSSSHHDSLLLHSCWAGAQSSQGNDQGVIEAVAAIVLKQKRSDTLPNSVEKLKIASYFQQMWAHLIDNSLYSSASRLAECSALFAYHAGDHDLKSALQYLNQYSASLILHKAYHQTELLHEAKCRLVINHSANQRIYQPQICRDALTDSLNQFPNNTFLLQTYADFELRSSLIDRLRTPLRNRILGNRPATLVTYAFSIDQEIQRYEAGSNGYSEHTVRSLFVKALMDPSSPAAHSYPLWRKWLDFEHPNRLENTDVGRYMPARRRKEMYWRAKQVFLDGFRQMPWHKEWAMVGLSLDWGGSMTEGELRQVYDALLERGLRIRCELP